MHINFINTDLFLVFFGSFYIVLGLSALLAKKAWVDFIDLMIEKDAISLIIGILVLPISLFIIVFYNNWTSLASIVLMVIGYIGLVKALVLLLWPKMFQKFLKHQFVRKWLWLDGISGILLGLAMLVL